MRGSSSAKSLRDWLRELYEDETPRAVRFRYGLLAVDRRPARVLLHPVTWADLIAVVSFFLAPLIGQTAAFLRVLRTLRLLHAYQLLARLREDFTYFRRHEEVILASAHLAVFLFVMTAIVYETQYRDNPEIRNYVDALYFTVSSLTTTGYGDVVLSGTVGRFLSVLIMIAGVTLFFRLARAVLQPTKVRYSCPACGLLRHDFDAVHCKACGTLLNIPDEGR
jgi:voltage-gated potassium channel